LLTATTTHDTLRQSTTDYDRFRQTSATKPAERPAYSSENLVVEHKGTVAQALPS